jgi:hypothetical protein
LLESNLIARSGQFILENFARGATVNNIYIFEIVGPSVNQTFTVQLDFNKTANTCLAVPPA